MNQKSVLSIAIVAIIAVSLVFVLKVIPLKTVIEDYGSQNFTIKPQKFGTTTLIAKKGWTVSGSYSSNNIVSFYIYAPDGKTTIFSKAGASSGTFSFIADVDGSYEVSMFNPASAGFFGLGAGPTITVTLQAKQTGTTTIL